MKDTGTVIIRIQEIKRPYSQDFIGYRILGAERNDSGGMFAPKDKFGNRISFRKPFLISQSSDFTELDEAVERLSGFIKNVMARRKYRNYELVGR